MMQSVYTNPVYRHCIYRKETGVDRLTVSKCIDVYCIVYTLYIQGKYNPLVSQDRCSKCIDTVYTRGVLA
jgi:hypothetical protein